MKKNVHNMKIFLTLRKTKYFYLKKIYEKINLPNGFIITISDDDFPGLGARLQ